MSNNTMLIQYSQHANIEQSDSIEIELNGRELVGYLEYEFVENYIRYNMTHVEASQIFAILDRLNQQVVEHNCYDDNVEKYIFLFDNNDYEIHSIQKMLSGEYDADVETRLYDIKDNVDFKDFIENMRALY